MADYAKKQQLKAERCLELVEARLKEMDCIVPDGLAKYDWAAQNALPFFRRGYCRQTIASILLRLAPILEADPTCYPVRRLFSDAHIFAAEAHAAELLELDVGSERWEYIGKASVRDYGAAVVHAERAIKDCGTARDIHPELRFFYQTISVSIACFCFSYGHFLNSLQSEEAKGILSTTSDTAAKLYERSRRISARVVKSPCFPDDYLNALMCLGESNYFFGDFYEAEQHLELLLKKDPSIKRAKSTLARVRKAKKDSPQPNKFRSTLVEIVLKSGNTSKLTLVGKELVTKGVFGKQLSVVEMMRLQSMLSSTSRLSVLPTMLQKRLGLLVQLPEEKE